MGHPARRKRPVLHHFATAAVLTLFGAAALWLGLSRRVDWAPLLACWLVAVNAVAFVYYGYDKARARSVAARVPEVVLHGLTAAGGSVGAYAGMSLFRHKTVKGRFRFLFWCIVVLQVALLVWVVKRAWWG